MVDEEGDLSPLSLTAHRMDFKEEREGSSAKRLGTRSEEVVQPNIGERKELFARERATKKRSPGWFGGGRDMCAGLAK